MIIINGREIPDAEGLTLAADLEREGLAARRLAVERGGEIVPRAAYGETVLSDGDRIEIVHFVGGG